VDTRLKEVLTHRALAASQHGADARLAELLSQEEARLTAALARTEGLTSVQMARVAASGSVNEALLKVGRARAEAAAAARVWRVKGRYEGGARIAPDGSLEFAVEQPEKAQNRIDVGFVGAGTDGASATRVPGPVRLTHDIDHERPITDPLRMDLGPGGPEVDPDVVDGAASQVTYGAAAEAVAAAAAKMNKEVTRQNDLDALYWRKWEQANTERAKAEAKLASGDLSGP